MEYNSNYGMFFVGAFPSKISLTYLSLLNHYW